MTAPERHRYTDSEKIWIVNRRDVDGASFDIIGTQLGVGKHRARSMYHWLKSSGWHADKKIKLGPKPRGYRLNPSTPGNGRIPWTPSEADQLIVLRDVDELDWPEIAKILNRSATELPERYRYYSQSLMRKRAKIEAERFDERDKRLAAEARRDITARFFGDPAPGWSALDQKRASA